jgi:hypothetical protein
MLIGKKKGTNEGGRRVFPQNVWRIRSEGFKCNELIKV